MTNGHVHLHVADLEASAAFYERFFGAPPTKVKQEYAKFLPEFAPINLALSSGGVNRGAPMDDLGIQVDSSARVHELLARSRAAGLAVREEMGTDCCYANQDKFWVRDPDGLEWEVYHLNHDLEGPIAVNSSDCCARPSCLGQRL